MKYIVVALIVLYQRFISPFKGFSCAHNALHQQGSCSHSVKQLVVKYGVIHAIPMVRARFKECGRAYAYLKTNPIPFNADLPCDCDIDIGDCIPSNRSPGSTACDCASSCDFFPEWKRYSKKTRRWLIAISIIGVLILSYVFYGRTIESVYLIDKGAHTQGVFKRLVQRNEPEVRVLLISGDRKYYSDIVIIKEEGFEYRLKLENPFLNASIDRIEILDARVNVANKLVVIGQILEEFDDPDMTAQGQRFDYRIKRRWHFF